MAVVISTKKKFKFGNGYGVIADITLDNSYPTGGEALTAASLGLSVLDFVLPSPAAGYIFEFDHANMKLKAFTPTKAAAAHTHVFTGAVLTTTPATLDTEPSTKLLQNDAGTLKSTDITPVTLGTPTGTNASNGAIVAAAATEVVNNTDLHAVVVRVIALGY